MEKTNIRPLGENVLIEPQEVKKKTAQGIYLPETGSEETPQEGKVIAVGESEKIQVKKGQKIIYRKYSGTDIEANGKKYIILKNEDVLAVIE